MVELLKLDFLIVLMHYNIFTEEKYELLGI